MSKVPPNLWAEWREFSAAVEARLEVGAREYGDKSLKLSPNLLVKEIEQELFDVCGWSFILWRRLRALTAQQVLRRGCGRVVDDNGYQFQCGIPDEGVMTAVTRWCSECQKES